MTDLDAALSDLDAIAEEDVYVPVEAPEQSELDQKINQYFEVSSSARTS